MSKKPSVAAELSRIIFGWAGVSPLGGGAFSFSAFSPPFVVGSCIRLLAKQLNGR